MTVIKDGSGTGFLAKVGANNDLHVRSIQSTEISNASESGVAFQAEGETTIVAGVQKTILILINNGDTNLQIGNIFISIKNETGKITTINAYIGKATIVSGGSVRSAINLNTGSVNVPNVTLYEDNPTLGGTDNVIIELYFQYGDGSNFVLSFNGGIVLTRNGSFRITCTGAAGAAGTLTCDASFQFWEERNL